MNPFIRFLSASFIAATTVAATPNDTPEQFTEYEVMSSVLSNDELDMWWRVRTLSTTPKDQAKALRTLITEKMIQGCYPVNTDWYFMLYLNNQSSENREQKLRNIARTALMLRVMGRHTCLEAYTDACLMDAVTSKAYEILMGIYDFPAPQAKGNAPLKMAIAARELQNPYMKLPNFKMELAADDMKRIIDSARGPESLYFLLSPQSFGKHELNLHWRTKAEELIAKGVRPHTDIRYKAIITNFTGGPIYQNSLRNELCTESGKKLLSTLQNHFHISNNLGRCPYSMIPIYVPEGKFIIQDPLIETVYKNDAIPLVHKLEIIEFLLHNGAPLYDDVFNIGRSALYSKREEALLSKEVLIPELALHYGSFHGEDPTGFLTYLIATQKGEAKELSKKLLPVVLRHPLYPNNFNFEVALDLPNEDDALFFLETYFSVFRKQLSEAAVRDLKDAHEEAQEKGYHRLMKQIENLLK